MKNGIIQTHDVRKLHEISLKKFMYKNLSIMYKHLSIFWLIVLAALSCNAAQVDTTFKDTLTLKEVVVTQRLIKHEAGKVIINVTPFRKGKTNLVDLLSELPGINVNGENINIIGKGSIKVMLNGRLKKHACKRNLWNAQGSPCV